VNKYVENTIMCQHQSHIYHGRHYVYKCCNPERASCLDLYE